MGVDPPVGVWTGQEDGSELLALVVEGEVFKRQTEAPVKPCDWCQVRYEDGTCSTKNCIAYPPNG